MTRGHHHDHGLTPEQLRAAGFENDSPWSPASQTQLDLLLSPAQEVLFGGSAGGGKSEALLGYAMLRAQNSLLLRREFRSLSALQDRLTSIFGGREYYRAGEQMWRFPSHLFAPISEDGPRREVTIELGSCPNIEDVHKFQGRPHDCLLIDEGALFHGQQIDFLTGWLRSAEGRACKLIVASNPPLTGEGMWLIDRWRDWLDPSVPDPARPGEIRWYCREGERWVQVPSSTRGAISRTYIPSRLSDNPFLSRTDYEDRLRSLPGDLSQALLDGCFMTGAADRPLQVFPNSWIRAAQQRWRPTNRDIPVTAIGVDCSRGGRDRTVIVVRRRHHVEEPIVLSKSQCLTGGSVTARLLDVVGDDTPRVYIDVIGVGSSVYDHTEAYLGHLAVPVTASAAAQGVREGQYANRRAQMYWQMRERMDPATSMLELPPSTALYSELAAPEYSINARGILIEPKESLIRRLGRSPDLADACVMACSRW